MRGLDTRLRRLENGGKPCPECGFDGDRSKVEIVVEWEDLDGPDTNVPDVPEFCSTCGDQLTYIVTWEDLPDQEG